MIATFVPAWPAGNSLGLFRLEEPILVPSLTSCCASIIFDHVLRTRQGGSNINWHVVSENALPSRELSWSECLTEAASRLSGSHPSFSPERYATRTASISAALNPHERLRLRCVIDAAVAALYGLDLDDLKWILKDCDHPVAEVTNNAFARKLDPKGFWRVDKAEPPERRHTVLTLAAFADLQALIAAGVPRDDAIAAFCGQPRPDQRPFPQVDGLIGSIEPDGWMLPDHFRLTDLGLGHDDRAQHPQPVAPALGPRFYDWQLAQDPAESWRECELHARNLLGEEGYERLLAKIEGRDGAQDTDDGGAALTDIGNGSLIDVEDAPLFQRKDD